MSSKKWERNFISTMRMTRRVSILLYRPITNDWMQPQGFQNLVEVVYEIGPPTMGRLGRNLSSSQARFPSLEARLSIWPQVESSAIATASMKEECPMFHQIWGRRTKTNHRAGCWELALTPDQLRTWKEGSYKTLLQSHKSMMLLRKMMWIQNQKRSSIDAVELWQMIYLETQLVWPKLRLWATPPESLRT